LPVPRWSQPTTTKSARQVAEQHPGEGEVALAGTSAEVEQHRLVDAPAADLQPLIVPAQRHVRELVDAARNRPARTVEDRRALRRRGDQDGEADECNREESRDRTAEHRPEASRRVHCLPSCEARPVGGAECHGQQLHQPLEASAHHEGQRDRVTQPARNPTRKAAPSPPTNAGW
jgi:hypothetical protein